LASQQYRIENYGGTTEDGPSASQKDGSGKGHGGANHATLASQQYGSEDNQEVAHDEEYDLATIVNKRFKYRTKKDSKLRSELLKKSSPSPRNLKYSSMMGLW
jgi:hypothetical protein